MFFKRFYCFIEEHESNLRDGIFLINIEIFDFILFCIDLSDNDISITLCNIVFGFQYK